MKNRYSNYNIYGISIKVITSINTVPIHDSTLGGERKIESIDDVKDIELALNEFRLVQTVGGSNYKLIKTISTEDKEYWQKFEEGEFIYINDKKCTIKRINKNNIYLYDQFEQNVDEESYNKSIKLFKELQEKVNEYFSLNIEGTPDSKYKSPQEAIDEIDFCNYMDPRGLRTFDDMNNFYNNVLKEIETKKEEEEREKLNREVLALLLKSQFEDVENYKGEKGDLSDDNSNKEKSKKLPWYLRIIDKLVRRKRDGR